MKYIFSFVLYFLFLTFSVRVYAQQAQENTEEKIFLIAEQMPEFPGGADSLILYFNRQIQYPEVAIRKSEQGVVYLSFVVASSGKITNPAILKGVSPTLDAEALRVIAGMPNWTPGRQNGKPVAVKFNLPVRFQLPDGAFEKGFNDNISKHLSEGDVAPEFPGGPKALFHFLSENIKYPSQAKEAKVEGVSIITFIVNQDGTLSDIKVLKRLGMGTDQEALRVVKKMPRWEPGKQNGVPVRVRFNLPIRFSI